MEVDDSENLRWELEHLRQQNLQTKLFVLIAPPQRRTWRFAGARRGARWYDWITGIEPASWPRFIQMLGSLGYEVTTAEPAAASVLTFDQQGREVRLTSAGTPEEIVRIIGARIRL